MSFLDQDGYPSEAGLKTLRDWPAGDFEGLLEAARGMWKYPEEPFFSKTSGGSYTLITGGWSGNEDIIGAMTENQVWWLMFAYSWERGGKWVFKRVGG